MDQQKQEWKPTDSWIVLDQDRHRKSVGFESQVKKVRDVQHPDSNWFDESSDDGQNEVKLTPALGLDVGQDSMAQAERSLGLAVSLDGIDAEFLKQTSQLIQENTRDSPSSLGALESESDSAEEFAFKNASRLKYGGRAPPVLGALAPPAMKSTSSLECTYPGAEKLEVLANSRVCKSVIDCRIKSPKRVSSGLKKDKLGKGEKKRSRRRRSHAKKSKWSCYIFGLGTISFQNVVPIVVSHVFTLLVGIYIGRQYRCCVPNRSPSNCQVAQNTTAVPSATM